MAEVPDKYVLAGGNGDGRGNGSGNGGGEDLATLIRALQSQVNTGFANVTVRIDELQKHVDGRIDNLRDTIGAKVRELDERVAKLEGAS